MGAAIRFDDPITILLSIIFFKCHISKEQNEAAIDFPVHLSIDAAGMVSGIVFDVLLVYTLI